MTLDVRSLPFPPMWVNGYITDELKKYDSFKNILIVPSSPTAIDDIYKNVTGSYPDITIQYDRLLRLRRSPNYFVKTEQLLYYVYGLPEQTTDAIIILSQLLDRSDAAAIDLNSWAAQKQLSQTPILKDPMDPNPLPAKPNVYFHDIRIYQLEEARDLGELETVRGLVVNKMLIEYDYHYGGNTPLQKQYT